MTDVEAANGSTGGTGAQGGTIAVVLDGGGQVASPAGAEAINPSSNGGGGGDGGMSANRGTGGRGGAGGSGGTVAFTPVSGSAISSIRPGVAAVRLQADGGAPGASQGSSRSGRNSCGADGGAGGSGGASEP